MVDNRIFVYVLLALATAFVHCNVSVAQEDNWTTTISANFGCNIFLTFSKPQKFPGIRAFGAISIYHKNKNDVVLHYGPSLSIYTKTIGANLNPLVGDFQIDLTNTFSVGYAWGEQMSYAKQLRTLHNGDFYNLIVHDQYAVFLSTNVLLNNHGRHQILGSASVTIDNVSIDYNNDGVPFGTFGLADSFDRYWTGGGTLFIHHKDGFNRVEFGYDQFTGYQPFLYELSHIIGINVPLYKGQDSNKKLPNNFNTSMYQLKIGLDVNASVDIGFVGAMIDKHGKYWGVQDWIHFIGHYPFHPNKDMTRFFIGGTFNSPQTIE